MSIINLGQIVSNRTLRLIDKNKDLVKKHQEYTAKGMFQFATIVNKINNQVVEEIKHYEHILDRFIEEINKKPA